MSEESFSLYDLKIEVVHHDHAKPFVCKHKLGDTLFVRGSLVEIPPGQTFGLYAMLAVLPFVPAKQRPTGDNDWMSSDAVIGCTDPYCGAGFRITRLEAKSYPRAAHTVVPKAGN
ncbi:MAG: TIGR04076 family protein [Rhodospirillaceae bacterium]|nr:TIGR04076 family protein [Rhodospirillaceae bacterium]